MLTDIIANHNFPLILASILVGANVCLTAGIFYLRWLGNRNLFKTPASLSPVNTKKPFFSAFNGLYDFLDRIPLLRRSGTANEMDLFKAMTLVSAPYLALQLVISHPGAFVTLLAIGIYLTIMNLILLAHPLTVKLTRR